MNNNLSFKDRIIWIDALKGFTIILITFGHQNPGFILEKYIYSFHVCIFFFISGYLFKVDNNKRAIYKKTKKLFIPFLFWSILSTMLSIICSDYSIYECIRRLFIIDGNLCFNAPVWFLWILYVSELLFNIIKNSKVNDVFGMITCFVLFCFVGRFYLPFKLNLIPLAMFFIYFGNNIRNKIKTNSYIYIYIWNI